MFSTRGAAWKAALTGSLPSLGDRRPDQRVEPGPFELLGFTVPYAVANIILTLWGTVIVLLVS